MTVGVLRGGRGCVSGNDGGGVVGMTWLCCGNDVVVLWEWRGCVAGNGVGAYNGTRPSARRRSSQLTSPQILHLSAARCGAVAHQGERILCKDEVGGSSPPSSTRAVPFDYRGSRVPRAMNPSAVIPREGGNLAVHVRARGYRDTHTAMKQMEPQGEGVLTALAAPERARMEWPAF